MISISEPPKGLAPVVFGAAEVFSVVEGLAGTEVDANETHARSTFARNRGQPADGAGQVVPAAHSRIASPRAEASGFFFWLTGGSGRFQQWHG